MNAIAVRVETAAALVVVVAMIVIAVPANVRWTGGGASGTLALLVAGILVARLWVRGAVPPLRAWLDRFGERHDLRHVVLAGVAVQVLVAVITAPVPVSDFFHYAYVAERLAAGKSYVDDLGGRAVLPPGWPFALAPFVWLFGPTLIATTILNAVLYVVSALSVDSVARRMYGAGAAVVAVLLMTIWPSRLLMAGLAAKENLLVALIAAACALTLKALEPATRRPFLLAFAAGITLGLAGLTQPGLALLPVAVPLMYRVAVPSIGIRAFTLRVAVIVGSALIALAPWVTRNCIVFDGQFCGIATNGGSVFYRANSDSATGEWTTERGTLLQGMPELEKNRVGYDLGRQWILAHPIDAAKLSARKLASYLGGDGFGAYWSVRRATGGNEDEADRDASAARRAFDGLARTVSLAYWVLIAALCARAILDARANGTRECLAILPLVYPLMYGAAVFALFESGDRQHMFAVGPLIVLAAAPARRRSKPSG